MEHKQTSRVEPVLHYALAALGSRGDLMPILWAAKQLEAKGHRVTILANPFFADDVAKCGLNLEPVGTSKEWVDHISDERFWKQSTSLPTTTAIVERSLPQFNEAMLRAQAKYGAIDAVINSPLAIGAAVVAEKMSAPSITVHPSAYTFWLSKNLPVMDVGKIPLFVKKLASYTPLAVLRPIFSAVRKLALNKIFLGKINPFRVAIGLPPIADFYKEAWANEKGAHAILAPEWFVGNAPDWPKNLQIFNFPIDGLPQEHLAADVDEFLRNSAALEKKTVVFTFGGDVDAKTYVTNAIKASQQLGLRSIIISPNKAGMDAAECDKNVLYARHIPYEKLLGRCSLFVHHGGVGTISHAIEAGVPQIIMPRIGDQIDNAYKAKGLGIAKIISTREASTPGSYAQAMKDVLGSQTMACNVRLAQGLSKDFAPKRSFTDWVAQQVRRPQTL